MKGTIVYCCYSRFQGQSQTLKKARATKLHHSENDDYDLGRLRILTIILSWPTLIPFWQTTTSI